jgi:hypothetical protein
MRPRRRLSQLAAVAPLLLLACGDPGPGANQNANENVVPDPCPEGYRADGPACVPIFDDPGSCSAPGEMPRLGGGCRAVGVTGCATGFRGDGDGGCEPILPSEPCPPGTLEMIGRTECQPVGVLQCAEGFVPDGEGGCDAILPAGDCPPGTLEVIGYDTCQPMGDCGPEGSPWGLIETDGTTVYVDASADATGADGSLATPFPTINAALAVAPPGGPVALADGEYEEELSITRPVRLEGRCAARVLLRGLATADATTPAVTLLAGATGSEVRGVTVTGPGVGMRVTGARQVRVEEVEVRGAGDRGLAVSDGAEVTLRRLKVNGAATNGVWVQDAALRAEQVVVAGTRPEPASGRYGSGIGAECSAPERCEPLELDAAIVTGNHRAGVTAVGGETVIRGSVIRDTHAREADQSDGEGILVGCTNATTCGTLLVEGSLVARNRQYGIQSSGADATIRATVVRDTLARELDGAAGHGIVSWCDGAAGSCGSLTVDGCLVAGNRATGIGLWGTDTTVRASVIRDTAPQDSDRWGGLGIDAWCAADLGICGTLRVEASLVSGNHYTGIRTLGMEPTIQTTVVRDTLPHASDGQYGRGLDIFCNLGFCGSALVEGSLVTGNRSIGVLVIGVDTIVRASVVQDTRPQESDLGFGRGIDAYCDDNTATCGSLVVEGSLVARNREMGVRTRGVTATVRGSTVRDQLPREMDQTMGRGIYATCRAELGSCGSLLVEESLVAGNLGAGVTVIGADATLLGSEIHDTGPQVSDLEDGVGIAALCHVDAGTCGSLLVDGVRIVNNRAHGLITFGVDATVLDSEISDTLPQASDERFGRGINAQCEPDLEVCGSLHVEGSRVARNRNGGIFVAGVPAVLRGVAVTDTGVDASGERIGEYGEGVRKQCDYALGVCQRLDLAYCQVSSSHGAGVVAYGVYGLLYRSVVDTVLAQPADGSYGYGVQIGGWGSSTQQPRFSIYDSEIRQAKLAGVLFYDGARGALRGSRVSGGEYCVAINEGSAPIIDDDNQLACTVRSDPAWVSLYPAPAPPPALPGLPEEDEEVP